MAKESTTSNDNILPIKRFLSLKWKTLLFLSVVMVFLNVSFYLMQKSSLNDNYDRQRAATHVRDAVTIDGLTEQAASVLQKAGELIPELEGMQAPLALGNADEIIRVFEKHWPLLQFDIGVETVAFYAPNGVALATWGNANAIEEARQSIENAMQQVSATERPKTVLNCKLVCQHYVLVPVLSEGRFSSIILLSTTLAELIINFKQIAATDIGILTELDTPALGTKTERFLPNWKAKIVALTNSNVLGNVLQSVANNNSLDEILKNGVVSNVASNSYDIWLHPLRDLADSGSGYLVTIENVSERLSEIREAGRKTIIIGILGFLLSESVVLAILWVPLSRLRRTAIALPLLAHSKYESVRTNIGRSRNTGKFIDEIDRLDESAIELSFQLESLERAVAQRSQTLAEKMTELTRERDFVRGLLDTAQVIILTQDRHGRILLLNKHGESLTGYTHKELAGTLFVSLIESTTLPTDFLSMLKEVARGQEPLLKHESKLIAKNDESRTIAWLHSHLENDSDTAPNLISVGLDITDRKEAESRLSWLADHDSLTRLYNRRKFQEVCDTTVSLSLRYNHSGALLFLDLDSFKYVNDTLGHQVGDTLLNIVATELSKIIRETDTVARIGGDEFAILMPEIDTEQACQAAQKISDHLHGLTIPGLATMQRVSISIGIAMFPEHGTVVGDLLANADIAMYQAKEYGQGSWHVFSKAEQVRERIEQQVLWRQRIESALVNDGYVLYYQPIVNVISGAVKHYEVLLRMRDVSGKLRLPGTFIPIAEKTGQIHAIDHWVLRSAIKNLKTLSRHNPDLSFSINLSAHAFMDPELLTILHDLLKSTKIRAERLVFELTETAALADFTAACDMMNTIRNLGCKFALDDFGVGFSSFYYLKQLPVDYVKIDGSFIKDLPDNEPDQILVKAISNIAKGFGMKTIAEFVEDGRTLKLLRDYDVDMAQGYHIGRASARLLRTG